jgi:hypothetical protein
VTAVSTDNVDIILIDPEDQGFYKSRIRQWATLCPHMNSTEHRVFALLLDLCSQRNLYRKLTLDELTMLLPSGKKNDDGTPKPASRSTVANCLNALAALGQLTDEDGEPIRVSNKTKGALRIAPWRSLRHECTASRNVYDALDRTRGGTGDHTPRWPTGLGTPAQNSVPETEAAQNSVPPAQNSVPVAPNSVPGLFETPETTSENSQPSISPSSFSLRTPTHTLGAPDTSKAETDDSVCADDNTKITPAEVHDGHLTAAWHLLRAVVPSKAAARMQEDQRDDLVNRVAQAIADGWTSQLLIPRLNGTVNDDTKWPYALMRDRITEVTAKAPQAAASAPGTTWAPPTTTETKDDASGLPEIAPGVRLLPDGTRDVRYAPCWGRYCTGGSGGIRSNGGTDRRRIDDTTGFATEYCDTEITLSDGRITTCHPDARKGLDAQ